MTLLEHFTASMPWCWQLKHADYRKFDCEWRDRQTNKQTNIGTRINPNVMHIPQTNVPIRKYTDAYWPIIMHLTQAHVPTNKLM